MLFLFLTTFGLRNPLGAFPNSGRAIQKYFVSALASSEKCAKLIPPKHKSSAHHVQLPINASKAVDPLEGRLRAY
ncbi:hypothetical protein C8R43DRAFT_984930 [Mycena crocata]|nr:hypothetical protein C8R43DRAFT_984930 [Mycena crocata]